MSLSNLGGMSDDGQVVAVTALGCTPAPCNSLNFDAYFRNSHGWFHLASALGDSGVSLDGVLAVSVFGVSGDANMAWGTMLRHDDDLDLDYRDGFVVEFPSNFLRTYNPSPVPPADSSIVGVWGSGMPGFDPNAPEAVIAFLADGTYFEIEPSGFERGYYTFDGSTARFWTLVDTNGGDGASGDAGRSRSVLVSGGDFQSPPGCEPGTDDCVTAVRLTSSPSSLVGGWISGNPAVHNSSVLFVFTAGGTFFMAEDGVSGQGAGQDGIEIGTYVATLTDGVFTITPTVQIDTNGEWGTSHGTGVIQSTLSPDGLTVQSGDESGTLTSYRIIDPATVAIVTGGSADGVAGVPFSYQVSVQNAQGLSAVGLPAGLSMESSGLISGTPLQAGFFPVTVVAGNTFGSPLSAVVNIAVGALVLPGVPVAVAMPEGTPQIELTFDAVSGEGSTSAALVDPGTAPEPVPANFQIAVGESDTPLFYDISSDVTLTGPVTLCFSYAGVNFGASTPRLLHFDETIPPSGEWVDITSSVDLVQQVLCGVTSSFSPFVIVKSQTPFMSSHGFYAPVSPLAGFVNGAKAGSTVPLKFNVFENGVEQTSSATLQLAFSVAESSACSSAPVDQVDYVTLENTNLRYDVAAGQFILNWKTPKAPGCYIARVTNPNGLLVTATFSLR